MRDVVRARWLEYTEPLEGGVPWLYADVRGLITIAYGNLVDPLSVALRLPLMHPGGIVATQAEITADWLRIKGDPNAASKGHLYSRGLTTLRLTREGMSDLALTMLSINDSILRARIPDWEEYNACVQMAIHSLAWACGANFRFPKLMSAVQARDWDACSVHIQMREITPEGIVNAGLRARNAANRMLMLNASKVDTFHLDPDTLSWKTLIGIDGVITEPEIASLDDMVDTPRYGHTDPVYVDNVLPLGTVYPQPRDPDDDAA